MKRFKNICNFCSREIIFKRITIASNEETLNEIINNNKSLTRFGDGEFQIIFDHKIGFQDNDELLKMKLLNVLNSNLNKLLIGINIPYHEQDLNSRTNKAEKYWREWFRKYKFNLANIIKKNKKYYSALISRYYSIYKNKKKIDTFNYIKKLKKIWDKRDVLIIEGYYSRNGFANDLYNNTKSIKRILCPSKNAFFVYDKIINAIKSLKINKNILILISLGPTATVLSYDLCKLGFQTIDIGHIDIEYELYLRKYKEIKSIPYKYVNEVFDGTKNIMNVTDKNYYNQIILEILN